MRIFSGFCALLCMCLTIIAYLLYSNAPRSINGDDKVVSVIAKDSVDMYMIKLEGLQFSDNEHAIVQLVSIPSSQPARIEAIYSEGLDDYGFLASISENTITISMESDTRHPIKTFSVIIYAPLNFVTANGSGYSLVLNEALSKNLSLYVSGDITSNVTLNENTSIDLASAGSSIITLLGYAQSTNIALSGSTSVFAEELVSSKAQVSISGSGEVRLSVLDSLATTLKGASTLSYWGDPQILRQNVEDTSVFTQVDSIIPTFAAY